MPPIPKVNEQNKSPLKSSKNFVKENINKIINSLPICPRRYVVLDRKGNKFLIDGSGLQKDFICKKSIDKNSIKTVCSILILQNYGKIPKYLRIRQTSNEPFICDQSEDDAMILLPPEQRLRLMNGNALSLQF